MKKMFWTATAFAAFALIACSDNNSSSADGGDSSISEDDLVYSTEIASKVDEKNKTMTYSFAMDGELCQIKGDKVKWGAVKGGHADYQSDYKFIGDTLIITEHDIYGLLPDENMVFIGGKKNQLKGTWILSDCEYSEEDGLECYDFSSNYPYVEYSITITDSSNIYSGRFVIPENFDIENDDISPFKTDYKNSYFTASVLTSIATGNDLDVMLAIPFMAFLPDSEYVSKMQEKYNIKTLSLKKDAMTYRIGKDTISIKVNEGDVSEEGDEYILDLDVTLNEKTCHLESVIIDDVDEDNCSKEYLDYYNVDYVVDENDKQVFFADDIEMDNTEEFDDCLLSMHELLTGSSKTKKALAKEASAKFKQNTLRAKKMRFASRVKKQGK